MLKKINSFYQQYIDQQERCLLLLYGLMLAIGLLALLVNVFTTAYPGNNYLPTVWYFLAPLVLSMLMLACYARDVAPRIAMFTRFYTFYFIFSFCLAVTLNGIQFSPFSTIDQLLVRGDHLLGINTPRLIAWSAHHPQIKWLFEVAYSAIPVELLLLPALLALFKQGQRLNEYLLMLSFSLIVGSLIYYFFPTAAPVSVFSSPYFLHVEHDTVLKFQQIRSYIQPTTTEGGMIAFPSFHVIWAIICAYVLRKKYWLFIPIAMINVIAIIATVMLGWHYLMDVIAAIIVACLAIRFVLSVQRKQSH